MVFGELCLTVVCRGETESSRYLARFDGDESSFDELVGENTQVTVQLLASMHVLLTSAMWLQTAWVRDKKEVWNLVWCPVLQGMARLCCDSRTSVRTQALTLLQRSFLVSDLQVCMQDILG